MAEQDAGGSGAGAGIVVWHVTMSLDGYIAGPGDDIDWVFEHSGPSPASQEVANRTGALLVGRRSYYVGRCDEHVGETSAPYGGSWQGPHFVLSHQEPDPYEDGDATFVQGPLASALNAAVEAAGGGDVVVIGATVAKGCIDEGLLDEIVVHIAPVLLGDGVRLLEGAAGAVELERIGAAVSGQLTDLRYRVVGPSRA